MSQKEVQSYVGFYPRACAISLDFVVIVLPFLIVSHYIKTHATANLILLLILFIGCLVYNIYFHATSGQTLGKYFTKIKVVRDADLGRLGLKRSVCRESIALISCVFYRIPFVIYLYLNNSQTWPDLPNPTAPYFRVTLIFFAVVAVADYLPMFFTKKRCALHDFLGGSVVVAMANFKAPKTMSLIVTLVAIVVTPLLLSHFLLSGERDRLEALPTIFSIGPVETTTLSPIIDSYEPKNSSFTISEVKGRARLNQKFATITSAIRSLLYVQEPYDNYLVKEETVDERPGVSTAVYFGLLEKNGIGWKPARIFLVRVTYEKTSGAFEVKKCFYLSLHFWREPKDRYSCR